MAARADPLGLAAKSHPLRGALAQEMHLRQLPQLAAPAALLQVVMMLGPADGEASRSQIAALGADLPPGAKHAVVQFGDLALVWERHTEFATYTLVQPDAVGPLLDPEAFASARPLVAAMPGEVVRATLIAILPQGQMPDPEFIAQTFATDGLIVCDVAGGKARIWADFRLHDDGVGRLLVADRGLEGEETAQLIQRLQELGNYRNMALLGLPVAQSLTPELTTLETQVAAVTARVADPTTPDEPLLEVLTTLSAELARIAAATRYRMSATRAYAQICQDRLASLAVSPVPGYQTLADFNDRRLVPAVRTCDTFTQRIDDLSDRAEGASGLLRTRVDTALARQNRDLLDSMNRRTRLQLRLQQAVEGLSVVAISYYLVALVSYLVHATPGLAYERTMGIVVPVALVVVAIASVLYKRRLRD